MTVMNSEVRVSLRPRARRTELAGERDGGRDAERDGELVARVTAPPVEGRANDALCRLIAQAAGVAPSRVTVVRGASAREKTVRVEGVAEAELRRALAR